MTRKVFPSATATSKITKRRVAKRKAFQPIRAKAKDQPTASGTLIVREEDGLVRFIYTFGGAQLSSSRDPKDSVETFEQSRKAMVELGARLLKPGVRLPDRKGIPKFYADEVDPKFIVRDLDGKRERGTFENGQFKAIG